VGCYRDVRNYGLGGLGFASGAGTLDNTLHWLLN
jgi:hypothetical protein